MKYLYILLCILSPAVAKPQAVQPVNTITAENLLKDFEVLKGVLLNYHPGLYRFQDSITIEKHFTQLKQELKRDMTLADAYLTFSRFTAKLLCGHTFCSYYNQSGTTKDSLFNRSDKLPFTFFLHQKRMFIEKNLTENTALTKGAEIIKINNIPVSTLIDTLVQYIKGDGSNNLKRLNDLNLSGLGKFEPFDIYFPLLFPPQQNSYTLTIMQHQHAAPEEIKVNTVSRTERLALMQIKYGNQPVNLDYLWSFRLLNDETAYLKLGSFVTGKLSFNWKSFINDAFDDISKKNIRHLIIDVRGNEGGEDEVNLVLGKKLAKKDIAFPAFRELLRYESVSDEYRPYLNTWDKSFYNRSRQVIKFGNGFYTWKRSSEGEVIRQNGKAFQGDTYLLVDAANSSAAFFLAAAMQQNKIGTTVGSETGGNRKGTNGGQLFFLWLPYSKIEVDIPLIGYYPLTEEPDKGITPDVEIPLSVADVLSDKDKVLETVLEMIRKK